MEMNNSLIKLKTDLDLLKEMETEDTIRGSILEEMSGIVESLMEKEG